ncbi:hypothetical protein BKA82DRAFT_4223326 [Pisolithus tinctorius]|nr:hypothetical protein BKA82DRAFT_4223326 [Pisolithus tinctorius]
MIGTIPGLVPLLLWTGLPNVHEWRGATREKEKSLSEMMMKLNRGRIEVGKKIQHGIGDDFIPFEVGEDGGTADQHEQLYARQKGKGVEREWDKGKLLHEHDGDSRSRGTKRKHDDLSDDDGRNYKRTWPVARSAPWVNDVDWDSCHNVAEFDEVRTLIVSLVSRAITSAFPDARISPFGSYETKLYLPDGDIDLVVDSESMAHSNKVHVLYALANTIKRAGITSKFTVIAKAKVPIIKFVTNYGRVNVINGFLRYMDGCGSALRQSGIGCKSVPQSTGDERSLHGWSGKLQHSVPCYKLPADAPKNQERRNRCGEKPWDPCHGIFELFGRYFNYEEVGISVRNGGGYFSKRQRGWYDSVKSNLLSVEDPIDPTNDISKGSYGIAKVRQTFAGAHEIMLANAFHQAGILNSRRERRDIPLRPHRDPGDLSILSKILGVTQETINNRRLLQEVHDSKVLHHLLGISDAPTYRREPVILDYGLEEGDMDLSSDEDVHRPDDSDEDGKYHIQRKRPAHGRSNTPNHFNSLTVYTTDDDDDDDGHGEDSANKGGRQNSLDVKPPSKLPREKRRDFWLNKADRQQSQVDDSS